YREPRSRTQERLEWDNRQLYLPADEVGDAVGVQAPLCPRCAGLLKPTVVFFGEPVPAEVVERSMQAVSEAAALLVVGSSLTVWSGYRLVRAAREAGKPVYILNLGPTRADAEATLKVEAPAGPTLGFVASRMGLKLDS